MTERAKKLLLLYYKQSRKIRRVSGLPPLTFKAKKAGTLNNYRIYGNTVNGESVGEKTANLFDGEIEQGGMRVNDGAEVDSDYRIRTKKISVKPITTYTLSSHLYIRAICLYNDGVFVSTEVDRPVNANHQITLTMPNNANQIQIVFKNSATDTTDNSALITPDDFEWGMLNSGSTALPYEPYGYRVPVTVEAKNLCNNIWEQKVINVETGNTSPNGNAVCCDFIPVKPNVTYSCSRTIANNYNNLRCYGTNKNYLGTGADLANKGNPLKQGELFGTFMITDARVSYIRFNDLSNSLDTKYMLVEGIYTAETMPPYEPVATNLYLPEPIKMVGDEAEYIDYAEQKQHRVRKNLVQTIVTSLTINGVTFTVNANGSVTCNGTNHGNNPIIFELNNPDVVFPEGVYITSGCPAGGSITGGYKIQYFNGSGWNYELGSGNTFTLSGNLKYRSRILISKDVTVTNLTFYPMLRLASIEDDTYEPYIEDTELDVTLPAPVLPGTNTLTVGTEVQPSSVEIKGRIKAAGGD